MTDDDEHKCYACGRPAGHAIIVHAAFDGLSREKMLHALEIFGMALHQDLALLLDAEVSGALRWAPSFRPEVLIGCDLRADYI